MVSILVGLATAPFLFFLPGYVATLLLPWVKGLTQRTGLSIITSIALGVVVSSVAAYLRLPIGLALFIFSFGAAITGLLTLSGRFRLWLDEWRNGEPRERRFLMTVLIISLAAGIFISAPHLNYPWPIHADEWWMVGTVQNLLEGKSLNLHPYLFTEFTNDKPGFTAYLAGVFGLWGADPVRLWPYLPAANIFLTSLVGALLVFHYTRNIFAGGSLPIFLTSLRSNAYMLGWWFFVPSMAAFSLLLPLLFSFSDWRRSGRGIAWAIVVFGALALVYLPFAALAVLAFLPGIIAAVRREKRWLFAAGLTITVIGAVAIGVIASPYKTYWRTVDLPALPRFLSDFIQAFFVPLGATFHRFAFTNPLLVISVPFLFFAAVGLWRLRTNQWAAPAGWAVLLGGLNVFLVLVAGVSFLLFHQRAFYFFGVLAAALAALGAGAVFPWLAKIRWRYFIGALFAGGLVFLMFFQYFNLPNFTLLYYLVNGEDLAALTWLKSRSGFAGMTVVADRLVGTIITPFTRLPSKITLLTSQSVAGDISREEYESWIFSDDCSKKKAFLEQMGADLAYVRQPQSCPFLTELYRSPHVFIYLVR